MFIILYEDYWTILINLTRHCTGQKQETYFLWWHNVALLVPPLHVYPSSMGTFVTLAEVLEARGSPLEEDEVWCLLLATTDALLEISKKGKH